MSYDKRKHVRETFSSILAGIVPTTLPTLRKKKEKYEQKQQKVARRKSI